MGIGCPGKPICGIPGNGNGIGNGIPPGPMAIPPNIYGGIPGGIYYCCYGIYYCWFDCPVAFPIYGPPDCAYPGIAP